MKYKERCFVDYDGNLATQLIKNKIKYKISESGQHSKKYLVFSIYKDHESYSLIKSMLPEDAICHCSAEFTSTELLNAQWLTIRPMYNKVQIINAESSFEVSCEYTTRSNIGGNDFYLNRAHHQKQVGLIKIKKDIQWKKDRYFYASASGYGEIFTNTEVEKFVLENNLKGIEIKPVLSSNDVPCQNTFQLWSEFILTENAFKFGFGEKKETCPMCGKAQYIYDGYSQLHIYNNCLSDEYDMYMTDNIFGPGIAKSEYIISNKFYRLLHSQKMCKEAIFMPVVTV